MLRNASTNFGVNFLAGHKARSFAYASIAGHRADAFWQLGRGTRTQSATSFPGILPVRVSAQGSTSRLSKLFETKGKTIRYQPGDPFRPKADEMDL